MQRGRTRRVIRGAGDSGAMRDCAYGHEPRSPDTYRDAGNGFELSRRKRSKRDFGLGAGVKILHSRLAGSDIVRTEKHRLRTAA